MPKTSLTEINKERITQGLQPFANCRNAAAGTLRNLDTSVCKKRKLNAWIYYLWNAKDFGITTHYDALEKMKEWGFRTNPETAKLTTKDILKYVSIYTQKRQALDYDIDGIVLKVNEFKYYDGLGKTAKVPHWAIAYKFPPELVIAKLNAITYQVGRTGKVTPVAELSPTLIAGSLVKRATLHNEDYINDKGIKIGDYVILKKAGDVIPAVDSVVTERRNGSETDFKMITTCPICGQLLKKIDAHHFCLNENCSARILNKLIHFCSKEAMDIDGLGEKTCEQLFNAGVIQNYESIMLLPNATIETKKKIYDIDGIGEKTFERICNGIEESKKKSLECLLTALGIKEVGGKMAQVLAEHYKTMDGLKNASLSSLLSVDGIGTIAANEIFTWFNNSNNRKMLDNLEAIGLNMKYASASVKTSSVFAGKTFVITGTLSSPRQDFEKLITDNGGAVSSSVSSKTSYVLLGTDPGSKYEKAKKLGVTILSETDFRALLK